MIKDEQNGIEKNLKYRVEEKNGEFPVQLAAN